MYWTEKKKVKEINDKVLKCTMIGDVVLEVESHQTATDPIAWKSW
jgi:hypothetical protein